MKKCNNNNEEFEDTLSPYTELHSNVVDRNSRGGRGRENAIFERIYSIKCL
jgi:hypothetical protein